MKNVILAYIPVLHSGYVKFLKKYGGSESQLYVFGSELIGLFDPLRKDIRALDRDLYNSGFNPRNLHCSSPPLGWRILELIPLRR